MTVVWTPRAKKDLQDIFEYYQAEATTRVAQKMVSLLLKRSQALKKLPYMGPIEPALNRRKFIYRFLVVENWKLLYHVQEKKCIISKVYDCRQDPLKMESLDIDA